MTAQIISLPADKTICKEDKKFLDLLAKFIAYAVVTGR